MFSSQPCSFLSFNFLQGDFCILAKWDEIKGNIWNSIILTWKKQKQCRFQEKCDRWAFDQKKYLKDIWYCSFFFNLCTHIFNRLRHKVVPTFLQQRVSYSLFQYFDEFWKRMFYENNQNYSENIWKEGNHGHSFVWVFVMYISVKKKYQKRNFCWCKRSKCGKSS